MKLVPLCTCALAASLYAAECSFPMTEKGTSSINAQDGYPTTALYLFEDYHLDLSNMDKREPAVTNVSGSDTVWMYRSELDSTLIVIVSEAVVKVARVAYSENPDATLDSLFSVHHNDVMLDEFPRLQKAGVYKGTAEQADSLANHAMELCRRFYNKYYGYAGCEFNPPDRRRRNDGHDIDAVDIPLAMSAVAGVHSIALDTLNYCPDYRYPAPDTATVPPDTSTTPDAILGTVKAKAAFSKIKPGLYRIDNVVPGTPYKAFSANGQLLEQGTLKGDIFAAPTLPVILQINGKRTLFLK